jgi:hypothetical protein
MGKFDGCQEIKSRFLHLESFRPRFNDDSALVTRARRDSNMYDGVRLRSHAAKPA